MSGVSMQEEENKKVAAEQAKKANWRPRMVESEAAIERMLQDTLPDIDERNYDQLKSQNEKEIGDLKASNDKKLTEMNNAHSAALAQLKAENEKLLTELAAKSGGGGDASPLLSTKIFDETNLKYDEKDLIGGGAS